MCRRIVRQYAIPLRNLILKEAQSLSAFPTPEKLEDFPALQKSGLRNVLYIDLIGGPRSLNRFLVIGKRMILQIRTSFRSK